MKSRNIFNKLWIIESLSDGELKTGLHLYEGLFPSIKKEQPELIVSLEQPNSKDEFLYCLETIYKDVVENRNYPLIHLECHGCEKGLGLANKEIVEWNEIRDLLIQINFACEVNLLVVVAACKGAYLIHTATQLDRAPFYAIVGSEQEVKAGELQADFTEFYKSFFLSLNGNKAIESLNRQAKKTNRLYHFVGAEVLFLKAFRKYHRDHCIGKAKQSRLEDLVTKAMVMPEVSRNGVNWARNQAKEWFKNEQEPAFERMKARFFWLDEYPHNQERFTVSYVDVLQQ
ncbi:hypothetical protein [Simiduia aestuariiviva]|uniref:CHAT domain-containing protein n=1 Tax=Simiduia aestuariiviva TaxID=1510459 RepID=A0A839UUF3_9GAMM|nr:hypothetical protein [Simiduia aestuariiviva]MBB3169007.1 hypothetical protein [Simiduia aestuariiviva]